MTIATTTGPRKARPTMTAARTTALALSLVLLGAGPGAAEGASQNTPDLRALARALATTPDLGAPSQAAPGGGPAAAIAPVAPVAAPPLAVTRAVPSVLDEGAPASGWPSSAADLERMARDAQAANAGDSADPVAAAICAFLARHADGVGANAVALAAPLCDSEKE